MPENSQPKFKRIYLIIIILLVIFGAYTFFLRSIFLADEGVTETDTQSKLTTLEDYKNKELGFCISKPKGWRINDFNFNFGTEGEPDSTVGKGISFSLENPQEATSQASLARLKLKAPIVVVLLDKPISAVDDFTSDWIMEDINGVKSRMKINEDNRHIYYIPKDESNTFFLNLDANQLDSQTINDVKNSLRSC